MQVRLGYRRYTVPSRQGWGFMAASWLVSWLVFVLLVWGFCEYDDLG
jgi:hypothetical protein